MKLSLASPLLLPALLVGLAACGTETGDRADDASGSPSASSSPSRPPMPSAPVPDGEVRTPGLAIVMDAEGERGPELCLGPVAESYPPQCGGPAMAGWSWADHPMHEKVGKVRWGSFALTGTWDGTSFTATEAIPAALYDTMEDPRPEPAYDEPGTPCAEPDGGWQVVDEATTTPQSLDATLNAAARLPGYAQAWLDQSINPADPEEQPEKLNDPTKLVLNVAVTEDLEGAEATLRETWGGALCVSEAERTEAELTEVATELGELPGSMGAVMLGDGVVAEVVYDDGTLQSWVDEVYGEGLVEVSSVLQAAG